MRIHHILHLFLGCSSQQALKTITIQDGTSVLDSFTCQLLVSLTSTLPKMVSHGQVGGIHNPSIFLKSTVQTD